MVKKTKATIDAASPAVAPPLNYYKLLAINHTASSVEIKRAYRVQALKLHPDKHPGKESEFMAMKRGYDILSDPAKRDMYDKCGESGVLMMEDATSLTPEQMKAMLCQMHLSCREKTIGGSCFLLFFGFLTILPLFCCLRADGTIGWNWAIVFIPIWILNALGVCCVGVFPTDMDEDDDDAKADTEDAAVHEMEAGGSAAPSSTPSHAVSPWKRRLWFLHAVCLLTFQILVVIALNQHATFDTSPLNAWFIFSPLFLLEAVRFSQTLVHVASTSFHASPASPSSSSSPPLTFYQVMSTLVMQALRVGLELLLVLKLHRTTDMSWWLVFLPVWLFLGMVLTRLVLATRPSSSSGHSTYRDPNAPSNNTAEEDAPSSTPPSPPLSKMALVFAMGGLALVTSPLYILVTRLQSGDFTTVYIMLPYFMLLGLMFVLSALSLAALLYYQEASPSEAEEDKGAERTDSGTVPIELSDMPKYGTATKSDDID